MIKKLTVLLCLFLLVLIQFPLINKASAELLPTVSVKLKNYLGNPSQVSLSIHGRYSILNSHIQMTEGKQYLLKVEKGLLSLYENSSLIYSSTKFEVVPNEYGIDNYVTINNRPYLGNMQFIIENNNVVRPINVLPIEDYLKGVVPFEMMASWNIEALKSQAVAARTYVSRYSATTIDDTINYQAYGGYDWNPNSTKAVDDTRNQTLTFNGKLIDALYSASNGGITESNANVWGGTPLSIFPIKSDPFDTKVPWGFSLRKIQIDTNDLDLLKPNNWWNSVKESDFSLTTNIKAWMNQNGYSNYEIKIISIPSLSISNEKTSGGRIKSGTISVQFFLKDKNTGNFILDSNKQIKTNELNFVNTTAVRIRAMIGINVIKSYLMTNYVDNGTTYKMDGYGNGHGVGLSQWGAKTMADKGYKYKDILTFYYPGTILTNQEPVIDTPLNIVPNVDEHPIIVDSKAPIISNLQSVYNQTKNQIEINYKIDEKASTTVYVKNSKGIILSYLIKNKIQNAGSYHSAFNVTRLPNGHYTFGVITTDESKNTSSAIKTILINKSLTKLIPKVNKLSNNDSYLIGTSEPKANITIKSGSKVLKTGTVDTKGKFKISIPKQKAGTKLSVYSKDIAGNISKTTTVTVLDKIPPAKPKVNYVTIKSTAISGTAEAKSTISIKKGSKVIKTGKADSKGKFKISIPKQKAGTKMYVIAKDSAGNISSVTTVQVKKK